MLVNPGLLFVASNTLVVSGTNGDESWSLRYFANRRPFFVALGLLPAGSVVRDWFLVQAPIIATEHIPEVIVTTICIVGWVSESRRVHAFLVLAILLVFTASSASLWFEPGKVGGLF